MANDMDSTPAYFLSQAEKADFAAIRSLIHAVRINPMGLDWQHFIVAKSPAGELIGCGQVKSHRDGSQELASIAVVTAWRSQGVASRIIEHEIREHPGKLYLTCQASLGTFYARFGFQPVTPELMPLYFRRLSRLANLIMKAGMEPEGLLVMVRE